MGQKRVAKLEKVSKLSSVMSPIRPSVVKWHDTFSYYRTPESEQNMTLELNEQELIAAVSDFLAKKNLNFDAKSVVFDCDWDQRDESHPSNFTAKVNLSKTI